MPITLGVDLSHYQPDPDFAAMAAAGIGFVIHKVTEGTGYVDPRFADRRAGAHGAGLVFGGYAFARETDPVAEARFFLDTFAPRPGELVAEDMEVNVAGVDPVAWSVAWGSTVKAAVGCPPFLYGNQSTFAAHDWAPVLALGEGQWLARYDGAPAGQPVAGWPVLALKQFTDRAQVPGIAGPVDEDAFQGDLAALLRYAVPGTPPPPPAPAPPPPAPAPPPPLPAFDVRAWRANYGDNGQVFADLQVWLNRCYPLYSHISPVAPHYGPQTAAVLREFAHRSGIPSADGTNIGPRIAAALWAAGFRG